MTEKEFHNFTNSEFSSFVSSALTKVCVMKIANKFNVSVNRVYDWAVGKNIPGVDTAELIANYITQLLAEIKPEV